MSGDHHMPPGERFAIGLYRGPSPIELRPAPGVVNPVFTHRDVGDPAAHFVADPFLIRHDDLWYLFFEVMREPPFEGDVGVATSRDARTWQYRGLALVEPFHLSYPHVFRWRGQCYMTPEMWRQDCVRLYRAAAFPFDWRPVATLLEAGPVADPTPFRFDGRWWLFTCPRPMENDEIRLYHAARLTGPYREHRRSPIVTGDRRRARPAGRVVAWEGGLVRYAQDCVPEYGAAVRAFRITRLTVDEYAERPVAAPPLRPGGDERWNRRGMHHVDAHLLDDGSWLAAVDGRPRPSGRRSALG